MLVILGGRRGRGLVWGGEGWGCLPVFVGDGECERHLGWWVEGWWDWYFVCGVLACRK